MSDEARQSEPEVVPHEAGAPPDAVATVDTPADEPAPDGAARPSVAPRPSGWRDETVGTAMVTFIVGIWLVFSPEALGYAADDATVNIVVCGVLVSVFSLARLIGPWRSRTLGHHHLPHRRVAGRLVVPPGGANRRAVEPGALRPRSSPCFRWSGSPASERGRELNPG